ncbi:MAG: cation transporter, partial [Sedimentisphaerales bacterium]|nr:cation transporter [Sedimentisphaerales bacterium]
LGRLIDSDTLRADAWNHRFDVLATLVVVGSLAGARYNHLWIDGVGGVIVSGIILLTAAKIVRTAIDPLLGEPPSVETLGRIAALARAVKGVEGVHDIIVHRYGRMWIISLHVEVRDDVPVGELHDLSEQVEEVVEQEFSGDTVVHLDPINKAHPRYEEIERALIAVTAAEKRISSFHDLRLIGRDDRLKAVFDIVPRRQLSVDEAQQLKRDLRQQLRLRLEQVRFSITVEPIYKKTVKETDSPAGKTCDDGPGVHIS